MVQDADTLVHPTPVSPVRQIAAGVAGVAGLVSAAVALGVGELVAGLDSRFASPVEAVAGEVIDRAPRPLERFAIDTFGTNDKLALVTGTVALSAVFGVVLGIATRHHPRRATVGIAAFALVGVLASWSQAQAQAQTQGGGRLVAGLPSLVAGLAGAVSLRLPRPQPRPRPRPTSADGPEPPRSQEVPRVLIPITRGGMADRRVFLTVTAAAAAGAGLAAAGGRALRSRFSAADSRARVVLPGAAAPLAPLAAGVEVGVPGSHPSSRRTPTSTGSTRRWSSPRFGPRTGRCGSPGWSTGPSSCPSPS